MTFLNLKWSAIFILSFSAILYIGLSLFALKKLKKKKFILGILRLLTFLTFSLAFLRLALLQEREIPSKGKIAVLVDTSGSVFLPSPEKGALSNLKKRWSDILRSLRDEGFNVEIFSIDEVVAPFKEEMWKGRDRETRLVDALNSFIKKRRGEFNSLLLFSDGYDHSVLKANSLKKFSLPVNAVLLPFPDEKDLWVEEVKIPYLVFRKVPVSLSATIKSKKMKGYYPFSIYLNGEKVKSGRVKIEKGEGKIDEEITIYREGDFIISVRVESNEDEITRLNNIKVKKLKVVRDRIRTLQLVGTPTWDVRFLRRFLKKNRSVELITFMILRTPEDFLFFSDEELSLIPFPAREIFEEALNTFDVVYFQNFNYAPYLGYKGPLYLQKLGREIKKGLGFVMLGGDRAFSKGGYAGTALSRALPVRIKFEDNPLIKGEFKVVLTEEGEKHPLTAFLKEYEDTLPPLTSINLDVKPKQDASVLIREKKHHYPVFVVGNYGEGRVCVIATDSLWKWYFTARGESGIDLYTPLMEKILYWAGQDYTFSEVRLKEDSEGALLEVEDRFLKPCKECSGSITLISPQGDILLQTPFKTDKNGNFRITRDYLSFPSVLRVKVDGKSGVYTFGITGKEKQEYSELYRTNSSLKNIAEATGGRFFQLKDFRADKIILKGGTTSREKIVSEVWNHPLFILFFSVIILTEWALRRKWGLE